MVKWITGAQEKAANLNRLGVAVSAAEDAKADLSDDEQAALDTAQEALDNAQAALDTAILAAKEDLASDARRAFPGRARGFTQAAQYGGRGELQRVMHQHQQINLATRTQKDRSPQQQRLKTLVSKTILYDDDSSGDEEDLIEPSRSRTMTTSRV